MPELNTILSLFKFTHQFAAVERNTKLLNRQSWETNPEHSFQLALLGWYLSDILDLKLSRQKVLEYAIVHDLVEVYAGDTDPHKHSEEFKSSKHDRELAALNRIKQEFPRFASLTETIERFESLADDESKFIYLLDKIVPVINTFLSKDTYYADNNVTYQKWQEWLEVKRQKANYPNVAFNHFLDEVDQFFGMVQPGFFK